MKRPLTILVALVVGLVILWKMFVFQVSTGQVAVQTTFGRTTAPQLAPDGSVKDRGSVCAEPGLYFRFPPPIQSVETYSTSKLQVLEDQSEEVTTASNHSVIVRTYLTWRISDPLQFYVKYTNERTAETQLRGILRDVRGRLIGGYRFEQLVNADPSQLKLGEIETRAREQIAAQVKDYGIAVVEVGVRRLLLAKSVTEKVFEAMKATRETLAANAKGAGDATAASIRSEADSAKSRIESFARQRAERIKAMGAQEAAQYMDTFKADENLAVFLRRIETLKKVLPHNSTILLDANQLSAQELLGGPPMTPEPKK